MCWLFLLLAVVSVPPVDHIVVLQAPVELHRFTRGGGGGWGSIGLTEFSEEVA